MPSNGFALDLPSPSLASCVSNQETSFSSASGARLKIRSSASSCSSSDISPNGRIWAGFTIAMSRPFSTAWCRKTLLISLRAGCESPKEILLTPRQVCTPGNSFLIALMLKSVSTAESRQISSPVASVKVSGSKTRSSALNANSSSAIRAMRRAISSLRWAVFAMPCSSMVRHITAALYCFANRKTFPAFSSPDSRFVELIRQRPGAVCKAASITATSVVSIISGTGTSRLRRLTTFFISSASSPRSVVATQISSPWAPKSS